MGKIIVIGLLIGIALYVMHNSTMIWYFYAPDGSPPPDGIGIGFVLTMLSIYVAGFMLMFVMHGLFLQMVTPQLALARSVLWPIYLLTGWPHGVPMGMD